jgi:hypothetical protein
VLSIIWAMSIKVLSVASQVDFVFFCITILGWVRNATLFSRAIFLALSLIFVPR